MGDANETAALKAAFGAHAYKLAVNSTKSMHGHLLGAAGGVEAVITALAVHHQVSPPTINIFTPDPARALDYVPHQARAMKTPAALPNSSGFRRTNRPPPLPPCHYPTQTLLPPALPPPPRPPR